jgi:hypothetical protein
MPRTINCLAAALALITVARAAEPIPPGVSTAPTASPVAVLDPTQLAVHQYLYVDFPRQLQALQYQRELAEAEIALIARRLETSRPSRSFGRYSATYTADLAWHIDLLAAQRRLECLRDDEAELWRQRRLIAEQALISGGLVMPKRRF